MFKDGKCHVSRDHYDSLNKKDLKNRDEEAARGFAFEL
jgi:hypothetical protein